MLETPFATRIVLVFVYCALACMMSERPSRNTRQQAGKFYHYDDAKLHKLCHDGNLKKVEKFVSGLSEDELAEKLLNRKGVFGYTPLHEAVASGKSDVLDFILRKTGNACVNCKADGGYTPLHLAASSGHRDCVKTLLNHGADISIIEEYGKTPKQTAELSSKGSIVRLLQSEEIIKEVETNGDKLTELLRKGADQLEPNCLTRALIAATRNDNHHNIGKLIVKGADNLEECMDIAIRERKPQSRAMLLLVKAGITGNKSIIQKLFGDPVSNPQSLDPRELMDDQFADVQEAVLSGKVSTVVPIEIAHRNGNRQAREELLIKTDVNQEEGSVFWHGLRLLSLDISWLRRIPWVKRLRLARNGFKSLPPEMGTYLKQVVKLDLQHNNLSQIPRCLLELPSLGELNLAHNSLREIPDVAEWSPCLTVLDLSHNQLSSLPINVIAPAIRALNLSHNHFRQVPICICSFISLHSLNLSENQDILTLPAEMGRLGQLSRLGLTGLKDLNDPPRNLLKDPQDCIRYLNRKLRCARGFFKMKLMLVGQANRGKTTLVARLQGKNCGNESTVGVDVSEWSYKPNLGKNKFYFSIWDFRGQEEYYATHQCFLSERSLYLLLFNLKHGKEGVQELKPWLNNIALRAPNSLVIIIGTHLDEVNDDERTEVDQVLHSAGALAGSYTNKLKIAEILPVGLAGRIENIGLLKEAIYNHAANYTTCRGQPIMGQMIPASYHTLDKQLKEIQHQVKRGDLEPIMNAEQFKSMVLQMNLPDMHDDDELKTATLFLSDIGSLLHYDDRSHNLNELYFIDPCWLCDMIAKIVTVKQKNPFIKNGILHSKHIPLLFKDRQFPWKWFEQYLALLDKFEVALPLDNKRVLVPSMLNPSHPKEMKEEYNKLSDKPLYTRFIIFKGASTPPGFWSRLLSRMMHSVQKIVIALDKVSIDALDSEHNTEFKEFGGPENGSTGITGQMPTLLPNFPAPLYANVADMSTIKDIKFLYWREGLFYRDPDVMFRIESLSTSHHSSKEKGEGVSLIASPSNEGKQVIGQLVDIVNALVQEWYPGLAETSQGDGIEQRVPCFECVKQGRQRPFEFIVEQCLAFIARNKTCMECGYFRNDSSKNHTVALTDIVPDLLLQDIETKFLLKKEDIIYDEDDASLLSKGGYGKVYRGKRHGKNVAIKKYLTRNKEAFTELRLEAKLLQKFHHPCIVCLEGVCVYPMMALVFELAPLGSLSFSLLKKKIPIHRLTIFRIALEVAAALRFVHKQGIVFRDIKADNVLLWTLNPDSLCHCKITDFGIATHLSPVGAKGLLGTKGFIAPEVLHIGKRKQRSAYDHKADTFSFAMFLYQMIARRHPYHDIAGHRIDASVENGERPKLLDVDHAHFAYYYLTKLMEICWRDKSTDRPDDDTILSKLCLPAMQSIMAVTPIKSRFSLCNAIAIIPTDFPQANVVNYHHSELWICCDGAEGAEINIYNTHTMAKVNKNFLKDNQIQAIIKSGDHVWVGSQARIEHGIVDIFSIQSKKLVHSINMRDPKVSVSCMTCSDEAVYIGTLEGYCFRFVSKIDKVRDNAKPQYRYVSSNAVDGIVSTQQCVWASHTRYIYFMNFDNLNFEGSINQEKDAYIGQLSPSPDGRIIWSAHLGGALLTAWDAHQKCHCFDVDTSEHLADISEDIPEKDRIMTAMVPAEDCVWVGMATGHILVFNKEELLTWFQPYTENVCFLTALPCSGPCETEECMVASGGKGFQSMIDGLDQAVTAKVDEKGQIQKDEICDGKGDYLVLFEAFKSKKYRQMRLIEDGAPEIFDNHLTVARAIQDGEFVDETHILKSASNLPSDITIPQESMTETKVYTPDLNAQPYHDPNYETCLSKVEEPNEDPDFFFDSSSSNTPSIPEEFGGFDNGYNGPITSVLPSHQHTQTIVSKNELGLSEELFCEEKPELYFGVSKHDTASLGLGFNSNRCRKAEEKEYLNEFQSSSDRQSKSPLFSSLNSSEISLFREDSALNISTDKEKVNQTEHSEREPIESKEDWTAEKEDYKAMVQALREKLETAELRAANAEKKATKAFDQCIEAELKCEAAEKRASSAMEASLSLRLDEANRKCNAAEHQLAGNEQRPSELHNAIHKLEKRLESAEDKVIFAIQNQKTMVEVANKKCENAVIQLAESTQRLQRLQNEADQCVADSEKRIQELTMTNNELGLTIHELQTTRNKLDEELHYMERRTQIAEQRVRDLSTQWMVQRKEIQMTEVQLGRGGWGSVNIARFRGIKVAAKLLFEQLESDYYRNVFIREVNMAAKFRHPNLVQFIGATLEQEMIILTELMHTSLRRELEKGGHIITQGNIVSISVQVCQALNYLHLMQPDPVIHRDISSANVLLNPLPNNQWKAKVTDYGSVNTLQALKTENPGSPAYAAPEARTPSLQSTKMDIFSLGVLLIEMCTRQFPDQNERESLFYTIKDHSLTVIIRRCIKENSNERPTALQLISELETI